MERNRNCSKEKKTNFSYEKSFSCVCKAVHNFTEGMVKFIDYRCMKRIYNEIKAFLFKNLMLVDVCITNSKKNSVVFKPHNIKDENSFDFPVFFQDICYSFLKEKLC